MTAWQPSTDQHPTAAHATPAYAVVEAAKKATYTVAALEAGLGLGLDTVAHLHLEAALSGQSDTSG